MSILMAELKKMFRRKYFKVTIRNIIYSNLKTAYSKVNSKAILNTFL